MAYSQKIVESYSQLQEAIRELLVDVNTTVHVPDQEHYPILSVETSTDSVGIASINGDYKNSYQEAYATFQNLYRENHAVWQNRNLSFVICRMMIEHAEDAFYSAVENDMYFCRKYVIRLQPTQDLLRKELLRLPFLPLQDGQVDGILRPPSAETFLTSINVDSNIARQLVVPREYSAKRIKQSVLDLYHSSGSLPRLKSSSPSNEYQSTPSPERTRVKHLTISGFRAYKGETNFDLDADIVVLYGPNGLGKTSFFDALDYACTGRIGRLAKAIRLRKGLSEIISHLGVAKDKGYVSLNIVQGNKEFEINRRVINPRTAQVNGVSRERANVLETITSARWGEKKTRIENLERLFRATHLFSQTTPELLIGFEDESTISSELVTRMLALDDYAFASDKLESILNDVDKDLEQLNVAKSAIEATLAVNKQKFNTLNQIADKVEAGIQIESLLTDLASQLQEFLGLEFNKTTPKIELLRDWRSLVDAEMKSTADLLSRIRLQISRFEAYEERRKQGLLYERRIQEINENQRQLQSDKNVLREEHDKLDSACNNLTEEIKSLNQRLEALEMFSNIQSKYYTIYNSLANLEKEQKSIEELISKDKIGTAKARSKKEEIAQIHTSQKERLATLEQRVIELSSLLEQIVSVKSNEVELEALAKQMEASKLELANIHAILEEHSVLLKSTMSEKTNLDREYTELSVDSKDLTRLLDEIEKHIFNEVCPVCSAQYDSMNTLVRLIRANKQKRPERIADVLSKISELENTIKRLNNKISESERTKHEINSNLNLLVQRATTIKKLNNEFKVILDASGYERNDNLIDQINGELIVVKNTIVKDKQKYANTSDQLDAIQRELDVKENELNQKLARQRELNSSTAKEVRERDEVLKSLSNYNTPIDISRNDLDKRRTDLEGSLDAKKREVGEAKKKLQSISADVKAIDIKIGQSDQNAKEIVKENQRLLQLQNTFIEEFELLTKEQNVDKAALINLERRIMDRLVNAELLFNKCLSLERSLDSYQRSAAITELDANIKSKESELTVLKTKVRENESLKKWVNRIHTLLHAQSTSSIKDHVEGFGPLSSLLQKRLRSVYGFGDIKLIAKDTEIEVEVEWEGQYVKPSDYFSDSQKQILMLSIFLANRLTQTWSGFAPILMDDPVTHFDDLNAYGMIELLRTLVSSKPRTRQFFISTCEERLYELMRKKFKDAPGGSLFYRFEGMGEMGPIFKSHIDV